MVSWTTPILQRDVGIFGHLQVSPNYRNKLLLASTLKPASNMHKTREPVIGPNFQNSYGFPARFCRIQSVDPWLSGNSSFARLNDEYIYIYPGKLTWNQQNRSLGSISSFELSLVQLLRSHHGGCALGNFWVTHALRAPPDSCKREVWGEENIQDSGILSGSSVYNFGVGCVLYSYWFSFLFVLQEMMGTISQPYWWYLVMYKVMHCLIWIVS